MEVFMIDAPTNPQLIVNVENVSMLNALKQAILLLKGVSSVREYRSDDEMSESEFFAKLDESLDSAKNGKCVEMGESETGASFLDRILCNTK